MEKDESKDSSAATMSPSSEVNQKEKDMSTSQRENSEALEVSAGEQTPSEKSAETDVAIQKSKSNDVDMDKQQQDASASHEKARPEDSCDPAQNQSKDWVDRVVNAGHSILWPQGMTPSTGHGMGAQVGERKLRQSHAVPGRMDMSQKHKVYLQTS